MIGYPRLLCSVWFLIANAVLPSSAISAAEKCSLCFYGPDNLVFDTDGNAYVTDNDHKAQFRVLKISPKGQKLSEWFDFPNVEGRNSGPEGIAIDGNDNIYVTDGGRLQVRKYDISGRLIAAIGDGSSTFHDLGHVAVDGSGTIFVAEGGANRIQAFSQKGERLAVWQHQKGAGSDAWNRPEGIAISPSDGLVVEDWGNQRILILSKEGATKKAFDGSSANSKIANSAGLCVDHSGAIFTADIKEHLIRKFDATGKLLSTIGNTEGRQVFTGGGPSSVATDAKGNVYAADGLSIVKMSSSGVVLARWR